MRATIDVMVSQRGPVRAPSIPASLIVLALWLSAGCAAQTSEPAGAPPTLAAASGASSRSRSESSAAATQGRVSNERGEPVEGALVADAPPRPRSARPAAPAAATVDADLAAPPAQRPSDAAIRAWLKKRATPLSPRQGLGALGEKALRAIVGEARIVGLGEAADGAADLVEWRKRLLEVLVREEGFTVYVVEASAADALVVDDYVVRGRGSARSALRALYAWKDETEENVALIEWMRAYNSDRKHRKKIHYAGFDPLSPRATTDLVDYLRRVDPEAAHAADHDLAQLARPDATETFGSLPQAEREDVSTALAAVAARLESQRKAYVARSGTAAYTRARQNARIIERAAIAQADYAARDEQMFETLRELISRYPKGTRFVIEGQLGHIAAEQQGPLYMGRRLREEWGDDYVAIALTFGRGKVRAMDGSDGRQATELSDVHIERAPRDTFEGALALAGLSAFLLDLRGAKGAIGGWLASPQRMHSIGGRYSGQAQSFQSFTPARAFDAVLYTAEVSASRPVR